MSVVEAVTRDLARFGDLKDSALAASALVLAGSLDDPHNSATSKSMCSKALRETLDRLRELAPPEKKSDRIDEVNEKREQRRRHRRAADA